MRTKTDQKMFWGFCMASVTGRIAPTLHTTHGCLFKYGYQSVTWVAKNQKGCIVTKHILMWCVSSRHSKKYKTFLKILYIFKHHCFQHWSALSCFTCNKDTKVPLEISKTLHNCWYAGRNLLLTDNQINSSYCKIKPRTYNFFKEK